MGISYNISDNNDIIKMNAQQLEKQLNNLKPAEKLQLIQTLAHNLSDDFLPKETSEPDSIANVGRVPIPVWKLVGYRRLGWSDLQILENFPHLQAEDLETAWDYAETYPDQINQDLEIYQQNQLLSVNDSPWDELINLIDRCTVDSGITDLAEKHNHYLYGKPKII